jgi:hypothetical protein
MRIRLAFVPVALTAVIVGGCGDSGQTESEELKAEIEALREKIAAMRNDDTTS